MLRAQAKKPCKPPSIFEVDPLVIAAKKPPVKTARIVDSYNQIKVSVKTKGFSSVPLFVIPVPTPKK
tara:strand:+ start:1354 stop:1554 length:201 start_codon:yes stop_codon:yes gene_type:complete